MKTNKNGVKLLAAIAVFAMVFAGLAVVTSDNTDAVPVQVPENVDKLIDAKDQNAINAAKNDGKFTGTATTDGSVLTLTNYSGPGFKSTGAIKIVVIGKNTITMERLNDTKGFAALYVTSGDLTIDDNGDATKDSLTINVNGKSIDDGNAAARTYGIFITGGVIKVDDIEFNMTVSISDNLAFGIQGAGSKDITFTKVTGSMAAGNRAIQVEGSTLTFSGCEMTIAGGEKAIQAKNTGSSLVLSNSSKITLELKDTLLNAGVNDRFGGKLKALSVDASSTLETQGLRIISTFNSAPQGTVVVSGGYEQGSPEVNYIAGLFLDNYTGAAPAGVGTTAAGFNVTEDAEVSGITAAGKSTTSTITNPVSGTLDDAVKGAIETTTGSSAVIKIHSEVTSESLKITDLKGKDLVLDMGSNANIKKVDITITKDDNLIIKGINAATTVTITNGSNQASISGIKNVAVNYGSVEIYLLDSVTSEQTITAVGDVLIEANISEDTGAHTTGTLNVVVPSGKEANIDISGITLSKASAVLNLKGGVISSDADISSIGTINLDGCKIDGSLAITGGTILGKIDGGNLVLKGNTTLGTSLKITSTGKLTVSKGVTLSTATAEKLVNEGTVNVYGTITGPFTNNGKVVLLDKAATISGSIGGIGTVDTSAIASYVDLKGDIETVTEYGYYQTITIIGDTTLVSGTKLTVKGTLIVNDGVTLTIEDGAQLIVDSSNATLENNGTIIIESDVKKTSTDRDKAGSQFNKDGGLYISYATVNNNGVISAAYVKGTVASPGNGGAVNIDANTNFNNNGQFIISEDNTVAITGTFNNSANAIVTINGTVSGTISNAGSVVIDGTADKINQVADKATVTIISQSGYLTVSDINLKKYNSKPVTGSENKIAMTFDSEKFKSIGGIVIVSKVQKDTSTGSPIYTKHLVVSGNFDGIYTDAGATASPSPKQTVAVTGDVAVVDTLVISKKIILSGGNLKVDGTVEAEAGGAIAVTKMSVSGQVIVAGADSITTNTSNIDASYYKVVVITPSASTTHYYTTLDKAIAGAAAASVTEVTVYGATTVSENVSIPAGMTVNQKNSTITIGSETKTDVVLTVEESGKITQTTSTIKVYGTLYVADKNTGVPKTFSVSSDVKAEGEKDVRYTNLANAIVASGTENVTIELNGPTTVSSDMTIPENVTIDMNGQTFTVKGVKLTIDGKLNVDDISKYKVDDVTTTVGTDKGEVVLNGYIVSDDQISYDGKKAPAGAYYVIGAKYYITSASNAADVITDADDNTVALYGKNTVSDISFVGTSAESLTINVKGELVAGTVTVDFATVAIDSGVKVTATFKNANGTIVLKDAETSAKTTVSATESSSVKVLGIVGGIDVVSGKESTYAFILDGDVTVNGLDLNTVTGYSSIVIDGNVVVKKNSNLVNITVNGTLSAYNGVTVTANDVVLTGTLDAAVATESNPTAGKIAATKIYAGVVSKDLGDAPVITGNVTATTAYIIDGVTVPESISKATGVKSTKFVVEEVAWMTIYTTTDLTIGTITKAPLTDAKLNTEKKWFGEDGKTSADAELIGAEGFKTVTANVKYDIYSVEIIGDAGIGSIAIDGIVLVKGGDAGENVFKLLGTSLKAGEHKVTFVLKDGFEGTPVLYKDGTSLGGLTFTLSGINVTKFTYNLSGTKAVDPTTPITPEPTPVPTPSEKDDSMGITEYLLIVLVVLAAILVVVVAIRMMRS